MTISVTDILVPACSKIPLLYLLTQKVAQKFGYVLGIGEAIREWTSKTGIEQGERTDEQMMDFINEYEYEDDDTYFYIRTFTFE